MGLEADWQQAVYKKRVTEQDLETQTMVSQQLLATKMNEAKHRLDIQSTVLQEQQRRFEIEQIKLQNQRIQRAQKQEADHFDAREVHLQDGEAKLAGCYDEIEAN